MVKKKLYDMLSRFHLIPEKRSYTNDLHEALLKKQGASFWKCWRSKFESCNRPVTRVNGISDANTIAEQFVCHFSRAFAAIILCPVLRN